MPAKGQIKKMAKAKNPTGMQAKTRAIDICTVDLPHRCIQHFALFHAFLSQQVI
jgi:hypothetical protein